MNFFSFLSRMGRRRRRRSSEIAPDEIFLDSSNLPEFNVHQFEGRLEKPISPRTIVLVGLFFLAIGLSFSYRLWNLQITRGAFFAERSARNSLHQTVIFSDRGVIYDRNNEPLAWNVESATDADFALRKYATTTGLSNLLGYVKYPSKDSSGFYYRADYVGVDGVEKFYDARLQGQHGTKITETDVHGKIESESLLNPPKSGDNVILSIDSRIQSRLYDTMHELAGRVGFTGAAGVIMDVTTGEIITYVTYPEYDSQVMTDGTDKQKIKEYLTNKNHPSLDRVSSGLYTPGSIVKPYVALAALNENIVSPNKVFYTTGSISIPNPYFPDQPTVFRDWKNHGAVDMRDALAVSSDVYFYAIGGGYEDQKGIGIANIEKYLRMFGFGSTVGSDFFGSKKGVIPNPEWKEATFEGEPWRLGNTYHTAIGQYGLQVTPMQAVRAVAALANYGTLLTPTVLKADLQAKTSSVSIALPQRHFDVIHEGMRQAVTEGTSVALNVPYVKIAAKSGTAELGVAKDKVNSWIEGFFPYENPRYAFVVMMERGPVENLVGATYVARQLFDWMAIYTPEYFKAE